MLVSSFLSGGRTRFALPDEFFEVTEASGVIIIFLGFPLDEKVDDSYRLPGDLWNF